MILGRGGYGWLIAQHGLAIDNLLEVCLSRTMFTCVPITFPSILVTLITASGEIVTTNAIMNEDLFWGVRGGGGNCGVVTNFVLKLLPQPRNAFAEPVVFPLPMLGPVVSALEECLSTASPLANAILVFTPGPDGSSAIIVLLVYHGREGERKEAFKLILDLGERRGAYIKSSVPCELLRTR